MVFKITGRVREKESRHGVRGLLVRAYDKDLLYDDLLGTALTDSDGRFDLTYTEKDFQELFDRKPDLYLAVYAPPFRKILDTHEHIRWASREHERFELEVERAQLGNLAPQRAPDEIVAGVQIPVGDVVIEKRGPYDLPRLSGFSSGVVPGAPSLLEQVQYLALPPGGTILNLEIFTGEPVRLASHVNPMPVQEPIFDVGIDRLDQFEVKATPPDPRFYERRSPFPEKLVEIERTDQFGPIEMVVVRVRPMQYDPEEQAFIMYPDLRYRVKFDLDNVRREREQRGREGLKIGAMRAEQLNLIFDRENVFYGEDIFSTPTLFIQEETPYVIITDNYAWPQNKQAIDVGDGTTRPPNLSERGAALAGDLVAEFEKLAYWKTSCGLRTRVVTVSEIIDWPQNPFGKGARDLQEMIRNFVKYAYKNWGTLDVLLGGDVDVVPIRSLVAAKRHCKREAGVKNPPASEKCFVDSNRSIAKLCIDTTAFNPLSTYPLSTFKTGTLVPFDTSPGNGKLCWYFTKETEFKSTSANQSFTPLAAPEPPADPKNPTIAYMIVEGPLATIDDDYYWINDDILVPSDLYYGSVEGKSYSSDPDKHDFDLNGNGLYGQHYYDQDLKKEVHLDGVSVFPDVQVGRVPAGSGDEARAFVEKLISYETLEDGEGRRVSFNFGFNQSPAPYLKKVVYATTAWYSFYNLPQADPTKEIEAGKYIHSEENLTLMLTSKDVVDSGNKYRLFAVQGDAKKEIPYDPHADDNTLSWQFLNLSLGPLSETPTRYVVVKGPAAEIAPDKFMWMHPWLPETVDQTETLRPQMKEWFPGFSKEQRFYEDYYSDAASIHPIEAATLHTALDKGCHFLSLMGHGNPGWCCDLSAPANFTNKDQYFIAFANSCSTARPDNVDSLGETSVLNKDGGAVAYVGNTRMSLTVSSYYYEEAFWEALSSWGDLGLAAGMSLATKNVSWIWGSYETMLYGDPTMRVWTETPESYSVTHPESVEWGSELTVGFSKKGAPFGDDWAPGRVTILGGWTKSSERPTVFKTFMPSSASILVGGQIITTGGQVTFELPSTGEPPDTLRVVVSHPNYRPYIGTIKVTKN